MALGHDTTLLHLLFYKGEAKEGCPFYKFIRIEKLECFSYRKAG